MPLVHLVGSIPQPLDGILTNHIPGTHFHQIMVDMDPSPAWIHHDISNVQMSQMSDSNALLLLGPNTLTLKTLDEGCPIFPIHMSTEGPLPNLDIGGNTCEAANGHGDLPLSIFRLGIKYLTNNLSLV